MGGGADAEVEELRLRPLPVVAPLCADRSFTSAIVGTKILSRNRVKVGVSSARVNWSSISCSVDTVNVSWISWRTVLSDSPLGLFKAASIASESLTNHSSSRKSMIPWWSHSSPWLCLHWCGLRDDGPKITLMVSWCLSVPMQFASNGIDRISKSRDGQSAVRSW